MVAEAPTQHFPPPRILTQLSKELVRELRGYLNQHRARVAQSETKRSGSAVAREYAKMYDGVLSALFDACCATLSQHGEWPGVSLGAVGSYGRSMLAPYSDLDVRLLCAADPQSAAPVAEALLYPLWDAGLSIGHQVVAVADLIELAQEDVSTATTLLDWRSITGDQELDRCLLEQAYVSVFNPTGLGKFVDRLYDRRRSRHARFGDSVYLLEPDVKNGAGGLRDLDAAHWCARARYRVADLSELVDLGILLPREWTEIQRARNLLLEIRHALHLCAGRRTDRLSFDLQDRVAEQLGWGTSLDASERLMSDYYRGARVITRLADTLFSRARPSVRRRVSKQALGGGLLLADGCVAVESVESLMREPALALRVYTEAVRRDAAVCEQTRQELVHVASSSEFGEALRACPVAQKLFLELLLVVKQTRLEHGSPLADLHDVGLLVAMIPEFAPLVGRVHRDTYHVYTVDVHSVAALDHLRGLCRGELNEEHPLASRLAAELPRHRVVFLATLLHDIGKCYGGEGHTERGVEMAATILQRLGVPDADVVEVQRLIDNHLTMYEAATRRDLEDPQTIAEFCQRIPSRQALHELYLLTIADVTTTNPTSMTGWKRRMLDGLFMAIERKLSTQRAPISEHAAHARENVLALWPRGEDPVFIEHFASGLPERYFYANEPASIVEHALFAQSSQARVASIRRGAVNHPYFELWVVADDRPGLLAMITATLSHAKLKVRSAQVYSWLGRDGQSRSLDIFWVRGPEDTESAERLLRKLERELEKTLASATPPLELERRALLGARSQRLLRTHFPPAVNVDNKSASDHTIVEVITQDRPALLFCLSNALLQLGLSIWFAKINTEGERVIDVFYVSTPSGEKVLEGSELSRIRAALLGAVERLEERVLGPGIVAAGPSL
jgi:[protein-PII] uridylyltransferase